MKFLFLCVMLVIGTTSCKKAIPLGSVGTNEVVTKIKGNTIYSVPMINGLSHLYIAIDDKDSSVSAMAIY